MVQRILHRLFGFVLRALTEIPVKNRKYFFIFSDLLVFALMFLSFNFSLIDNSSNLFGSENQNWILFFGLVSSSATFIIIGIYKGSLTAIDVQVIFRLLAGSTLVACGYNFFTISDFSSVVLLKIVIFLVNLFLLLVSLRLLSNFLFKMTPTKSYQRVAIYGAGEAGQIVLEILNKDRKTKVCLFIDDNKVLQNKTIRGVRVVSLDVAIAKFKELSISTVILAIPSAYKKSTQDIYRRLYKCGITIKTVPDFSRSYLHPMGASEISEIKIEDVLSRTPVKPNLSLMSKLVGPSKILVTGGGGSIGGEICRQIAGIEADLLVVLDVSEASIYKISQELEVLNKNGMNIKYEIGSVTDKRFIDRVFRKYNFDIVFHAAAYKHVPLMENNIFSAYSNNVLGTANLIQECKKYNVSSFTLISTDKAVNPTNVMGASKRLAELLCQGANQGSEKTKFITVRFGNVLGSSGSVVPLFEKQIREGGPLTVTHPQVTRYFMTISEASQLVIQASAIAKGGEIFVLNMGKEVKVLDLAKKMASLHGCKWYFSGDIPPENGIEIKFVGLRPGEKMYEELTHSEKLEHTQIPKIKRASVSDISHVKTENLLIDISRSIEQNDKQALQTIAEKYAMLKVKK